MWIRNGEVLIGQEFQKAEICIENGKILGIQNQEQYDQEQLKREAESVICDAAGLFVLPGFLDLHTHGAFGVDVNAADEEGLKKIGRFFASQGTTGWLCSVLTDTPEQTLYCIEQANKVIGQEYDGAALLGIHLEGPCLSPEYKGAMPEHLLMKKADIALFERYQKAAKGNIKYVTLSPEIEGAIELIPKLNALGIQVAIGHSGADYETAMQAIHAGAAAGTHVGNAMRLFHQHEPAIWGAVMESDVYCETICDGRHLNPASVRLYLKIKGADRIVAITDSIMASGLPDGKYMLGVNPVEVIDGDARLAGGGARAGSTLTTIQALRNFCKFTGLPVEQVTRFLTENPANLMRWQKKGRICEGADADFVLVDDRLQVRYTIVGGRVVYAADYE